MPDGSNYLDWYFQNMVWDFGGQLLDGVDADVHRPQDHRGRAVPPGLRQGRASSSSTRRRRPTSAPAWPTCIVQSTGSLGGITKAAKFSFGTAFLPGDGNCPTGGAGVAIPAGISDERKKNALKFIEFLTNADNTVTFTQATGYMPVRKSALDNQSEKDFLAKNPNAKTAVDQLPKTRSQDYARVFVPVGARASARHWTRSPRVPTWPRRSRAQHRDAAGHRQPDQGQALTHGDGLFRRGDAGLLGRPRAGGGSRHARHRGRRVPRPGGAVRLRQVDQSADAGRPGADRRRAASSSTATTRRACGPATATWRWCSRATRSTRT